MGKSAKLGQLPNAPTFSAYASAQTSLAATSFTKVLFATEEFDTNNNFASSRFTPTVAGYYRVSASVQVQGTIPNCVISIHKNGSAYKYGNFQQDSAIDPIRVVSGLVYLNGTTDYVEIFAYNGTASSVNTVATSTATWFDGSLARVA